MADTSVTLGAHVILIVAYRDAKRDEAAAEPAPNETQNEAQYPGESPRLFHQMGDSFVATELASHSAGMVRELPISVGHISLDRRGGLLLQGLGVDRRDLNRRSFILQQRCVLNLIVPIWVDLALAWN